MFVVIAFILLFRFSFSIQSTVLFIRFLYSDAIHRFDPFPFRVARTFYVWVSECVCASWYWFEIKCARDNEWYSHNVDYVLWWRCSMRSPLFFVFLCLSFGAVFYDCMHFSLPNWAIECVCVCVFMFFTSFVDPTINTTHWYVCSSIKCWNYSAIETMLLLVYFSLWFDVKQIRFRFGSKQRRKKCNGKRDLIRISFNEISLEFEHFVWMQAIASECVFAHRVKQSPSKWMYFW